MKKILIVSTVSRQFYLFEKGNIEVLKSLGYEVHSAANFSDTNERLNELDIIRHHIDIERSPFSLKNIQALKQLKKLMKTEKFDAIHCHSPLGGVLGRLGAKSEGVKNIIYTAHGFHFYKGAPLINWLLYFPIEKFLSRYTDVLITINKEDYDMGRRFKTKRVIHVPGIGVDTEKFNKIEIDREEKRKELGVSNDTVVVLSIGEMIKRKNHETALKALSKVKSKNFLFFICGKGELEGDLRTLAKTLRIEEKVRFLGFRGDIPEICLASDVFLFPSYQEGLPVSVMESMCAGLPIICSRIRGNSDLIKDGEGGYLLLPEDIKGFAEKIEEVISDPKLSISMGQRNIEVIRKYDTSVIKGIMRKIYGDL